VGNIGRGIPWRGKRSADHLRTEQKPRRLALMPSESRRSMWAQRIKGNNRAIEFKKVQKGDGQKQNEQETGGVTRSRMWGSRSDHSA